MRAERICLPCQPPVATPLTPRQDSLLRPRAHSHLLLSGLRGPADQENRSHVGPRALASRTPQRRLPFKPGRTLTAEGAHRISLSLLKVPLVPAFLPARPPAVPDLCHHASEAQEQVPCLCEMPPGQMGHSGGPGHCCCSPRRRVPLLSLICPSGFSLKLPCCWESHGP